MILKKWFIMQLLLFCFLAGNSRAQSPFDTLSLYFNLNEYRLTATTQHTLDSLLAEVAPLHRKMMIFGYADHLGTELPNQALSDKRAFTVKNYLLEKGLDSMDVLTCAGVGEVPGKTSDAAGNPVNRRVDVYLRKRERTVAVSAPDTPEPITTIPPQGSTLALRMDSLQPGQTIVLDHINFYPSSHQPLPEAIPALKELLELLQALPDLHVRIEGHICCVTDAPDALDMETGDMNLSESRAQFVCLFLMKNGIARERLSYHGFGRTRPLVAEERSEADAKANRRVEIRRMSPR